MRPPRREAELESIDVTSTGNIRQGLHPNRDQHPWNPPATHLTRNSGRDEVKAD
jgi:hypothetical protein